MKQTNDLSLQGSELSYSFTTISDAKDFNAKSFHVRGSGIKRSRQIFSLAQTHDKRASLPAKRRGFNDPRELFLHAGLKKLSFLFLIFVFLLFSARIFSGTAPSKLSVVEANQQKGELKYKVVEIKSGDSLWSIARENMTDGFSGIYAYIDEIKGCNQLSSDSITAGNYLLLPYYDYSKPAA